MQSVIRLEIPIQNDPSKLGESHFKSCDYDKTEYPKKSEIYDNGYDKRAFCI